MKILIAYATKHGSTREVADAVAAALGDAGFDVHVHAAATVRDVDGYDAVVVGGSIYMGKWHSDAIRLIRRHTRALSAIPVGVFAIGPKTLDRADVANSRAQLDAALAKASDVRPASTAIFGGVIDPSKLRFPFNRMPASDARDWNEIAAWARDFGAIVARATSVVPADAGSATLPMKLARWTETIEA
jgi:menaquinone-dependent protoporphyrinogen oxidase